MTTLPLRAADAAAPFADNQEFLAARLEEYQVLLRSAIVRLGTGATGDALAAGAGSARLGRPRGCQTRTRRLPRTLSPRETAYDQYRRLHATNELRLLASWHVALPFRGLAERCHLDAFDQDVLWLLFFKTVSPEFRQQYEQGEFGRFGHEFAGEIYIGNLLQVLRPSALAAQLKASGHFSVGAPLMVHHLVRLNRQVEQTILQVEVQLPQRVVAWIADDRNLYTIDCPFRVEQPLDRLDRVVLPDGQLRRVLALVEHQDACRQRRADLGVDEAITYGRGTTILEHGPSGTGKTLLARALAHHTGRLLVTLAFASAEDRADADTWIAEAFREVQLLGGILFLDECERICGPRSPHLGALLTALENTDGLVILATNQPEALAPALDRRLTLKVAFPLPDTAARQRIWAVHLEGLPLDADVSVDALTRTYPLAGGYIKNAVLTALNLAIARQPDAHPLVTQADLSEAASLQLHQVSGTPAWRRLVHPRFGLRECLLSACERAAAERIVAMARNHRVMRSSPPAPEPTGAHAALLSPADAGLRVLLHGASFLAALQAAEALAGELGKVMNQVSFDALLRPQAEPGPSGQTIRHSEELLSSIAGTDHLLVLTDATGRLGGLQTQSEDPEARDVFQRLSRHDGVVLLASACRRLVLPPWARIFHAQLQLGQPDAATRERAWRALCGPALAPEAAAHLARTHQLTLEQIQAAAHRCRLEAPAEEADGAVDVVRLKAAIAALQHGAPQQEPLFG